MSEQNRQESPLVERLTDERRAAAAADAGVTLHERPFLGYINLRGDPGEEAVVTAVRDLTGLELPSEPNTFVENERFSAIWLGPNEWYLVASAGEEDAAIEQLEEALSGYHFAVNGLGSGLTTVNISGVHARDLLQKGCTIDLHPQAFADGQCAQTLLAKAGILILYRGDQPSFDLVVRRSFADYLFLWLEDAAQEYGLAVA